MHYWSPVVRSSGIGGFVQAQSYGDHGRYALGVQGGGLLGLELGGALRESNASFGRTWGIHAGLYGSVGVLTLGLRGTIPVVMIEENGHPAHGGEIGLVLGVKVPIPIGDPDVIRLNFGSGRPLRAEGAAIVAPLVARAEWLAGAAPLVGELDMAARRALAAAWLADAAAEHASVAAFAGLSLELLAAGAPADLVAWAHRAALDEVDHARRCFALASAYAGTPLGPGPLPIPAAAFQTGASALDRLAVESFLDGCLAEGAAAACARRVASTTTDPAAREALERIARDEASHAALGWAVVGWCLERGGAVVARALAGALAAAEAPIAMGGAPAPAAPGVPPEGALLGVLAAHGRLAAREAARVVQRARRAAMCRLRRLLSSEGGLVRVGARTKARENVERAARRRRHARSGYASARRVAVLNAPRRFDPDRPV